MTHKSIYMDTLLEPDRSRYVDKLRLINMPACPFSLPPCRWINDPTQWPEIVFADIYTYLIESPGIYTNMKMRNHRSLDAHKYFMDGWVQVILHCKPEGSGCTLFRTEVKPSWRVSGKNHHTWVAVRDSNEEDKTKVIAAHCDCMAGLGETCSHVGAVLFKLEACVRLGMAQVACTSKACEWNAVSTKNVEGALIADIEFHSQKIKEQSIGKKRRIRRPVPKVTPAQENQLLDILAGTGEMPVVLSTYDDYSEPFVPKPWFQNLEGFTDEEVVRIEGKTMGQATSRLWHRQREGRITGSSGHRVMHTSLEKPSRTLIEGICTSTPRRQLNVPGIVWGRDHEIDALETYKYVLGRGDNASSTSIYVSNEIMKTHLNLKVEKAGFRVCREKPYMGVSCDGYVSCECCGKGVLECKCPFKWACEGTPSEAWTGDDNGHLKTLMSLKREHPYFTQVQLQMFVCQAKYADFITWTPQTTVIFRVPRDDNFIIDAVDTISRFWVRNIFPRLTGTSHLIGDQQVEDRGETSDHLYAQRREH